MTRLTLCVIARDEAQLLPDCLASVRGVVDEVVVVDTGSLDATVRLAEEAGARVIHHAWSDDFAAARNAGLAAVREGFVLVLDADERLAPGGGAALRAAVEADDLDVGMLPLHDADAPDAPPAEVLSGARRLSSPLLLPRLLRRTGDLAWQGVVHEHVTRWALRHPRRRVVDAPIVHLGAAPALREERGKSARNLRLLERRCAAEPDDAVALTYLGQDLLHAGETERALATSALAWAALERARAGPGPWPDAVPVATLRALLLGRGGRDAEALDVLARAEAWSGEHPNLHLLRADALERAWHRRAGEASLGEAEARLEACLALHGRPLHARELSGATSWAAATRLGSVRLLRGRPSEALAAFDLALATRPHDVEARLGRVEALLRAGDPGRALGEVEPLLHPGLPDGWILAAAAGATFEGLAGVTPLIEQARRSLAKRAPLAAHRARMLDDVERGVTLRSPQPSPPLVSAVAA